MFVGGPFYGVVDPATGTVKADHRERLDRLIDFFESRGVQVHNAHRREAWGKEFLGDLECTRLDYTEITGSDMSVAFPGNPALPESECKRSAVQ